ncbi:MAG: hypothetical protein IPO37_17915 [Saprospiraceae bacterium]|nr:hypothetical protein [Saprospiraceae bacterium]
MSIIKGDADKRAMFDQAMEVIADDVAKVSWRDGAIHGDVVQLHEFHRFAKWSI